MLSNRTRQRLTQIGEGVFHGFAQMGSLGEAKLPMPPRARSVSEALRSDWSKLGGDMRQAVRKSKPLEKAD